MSFIWVLRSQWLKLGQCCPGTSHAASVSRFSQLPCSTLSLETSLSLWPFLILCLPIAHCLECRFCSYSHMVRPTDEEILAIGQRACYGSLEEGACHASGWGPEEVTGGSCSNLSRDRKNKGKMQASHLLWFLPGEMGEEG